MSNTRNLLNKNDLSSIYALSLPLFIMIILGVSVFFLTYPATDLRITNYFYDFATSSFPLREHPLIKGINKATEYIAALIVLVPLCLAAYNYFTNKGIGGITPRIAVYIILCVAIGPGLLVNEAFKNNWGRARPVQIEQFGGTKKYSPPLTPSNQCPKNCSFTSGDASVGFVLVALAFLARKQRNRWISIAIVVGLLIGLVRIAQGAHFFSDVLYSGILVYGSARALHYWILVRPSQDKSGQQSLTTQ
jgi:lipid A 4'-phosphatase